MKVDVKWHDPEDKTLIYYVFHRGWGWEDVYQALNTAGELIGTVPHVVDVIMDFQEASMLPKDALSKIHWAFKNEKKPNIGITVVIAPNTFLKSLVSMAKRIWGENTEWQLEFVKTPDEAFEMVERVQGKRDISGV